MNSFEREVRMARPTAGACLLRSVSRSAWKGQTLGVQFRATTDGFLATAFRVDDVSLH
jgi:hypothetical protein